MTRIQVLIYRVASNNAVRVDYDELGALLYDKYPDAFVAFHAVFKINDRQTMTVAQFTGNEYRIRLRVTKPLEPEDMML